MKKMNKVKKRGRTRSKNSTYPFAGLNLKPEEDEKLQELLDRHDLSAKQLLRALVRQWMEHGGAGVLQYENQVLSVKRVGK